jgi:hypothetical protein
VSLVLRRVDLVASKVNDTGEPEDATSAVAPPARQGPPLSETEEIVVTTGAVIESGIEPEDRLVSQISQVFEEEKSRNQEAAPQDPRS